MFQNSTDRKISIMAPVLGKQKSIDNGEDGISCIVEFRSEEAKTLPKIFLFIDISGVNAIDYEI